MAVKGSLFEEVDVVDVSKVKKAREAINTDYNLWPIYSSSAPLPLELLLYQVRPISSEAKDSYFRSPRSNGQIEVVMIRLCGFVLISLV